MPADGLLMVRLAVSLISSIWSSVMVKVTEPLLVPLAIVIWVGMGPMKSAAVATPVKARSTFWLPTTGTAAVAVTVMLVVPASVPLVGLTERLTVSAGMLMVKMDAVEVSTPPFNMPPLS
jgi:hypothetical protein